MIAFVFEQHVFYDDKGDVRRTVLALIHRPT